MDEGEARRSPAERKTTLPIAGERRRLIAGLHDSSSSVCSYAARRHSLTAAGQQLASKSAPARRRAKAEPASAGLPPLLNKGEVTSSTYQDQNENAGNSSDQPAHSSSERAKPSPSPQRFLLLLSAPSESPRLPLSPAQHPHPHVNPQEERCNSPPPPHRLDSLLQIPSKAHLSPPSNPNLFHRNTIS
ncbi:hypothetical protein BCR35DRAFT_198216 [Leucosporidium creatinivorum]|uniref:Uncharacterized protein n=1 Tax=Leucosporidium creatinivorum TaxID=106004 RepID=A0A1Y2DM52_9BASI|nr:hypothetical protein BCR35DRAFT_198216 [Leucosporidium creatinivorum]